MATVCLDPGHGGRDPGAVRAGRQEKDLALAIASAAREALRGAHRVVLTRSGDVTLSLAERRHVAIREKATLFVSIHANASTNPRAEGVEVFVGPSADVHSLSLAEAILRAILAGLPGRRDRGIRQQSLGVLRQSRPAVLVECLFLSNPGERALLATPAVQRALGRAIAAGCEAFLATPAFSARRGVRAAADTGRTARRAARSPRPPAARLGSPPSARSGRRG